VLLEQPRCNTRTGCLQEFGAWLHHRTVKWLIHRKGTEISRTANSFYLPGPGETNEPVSRNEMVVSIRSWLTRKTGSPMFLHPRGIVLSRTTKSLG
jgi:hypothetical protein